MSESASNSSEIGPEGREAHEAFQQNALRAHLLSFYPEDCRRPGRLALNENVCSKIKSYVEPLVAEVLAGVMTVDDALELAKPHAADIHTTCVTGPRHYDTTTLLKCGVDAGNFYPYPEYKIQI